MNEISKLPVNTPALQTAGEEGCYNSCKKFFCLLEKESSELVEIFIFKQKE